MSFVALGVGLLVGNILHPGSGLHLTNALKSAGHAQVANAPAEGVGFVLGMIPTTLVSSFTDGQVLQTLLVALLVGSRCRPWDRPGRRCCAGSGTCRNSSSACCP